MWKCVCGRSVKNEPQNRCQHRRRCEEYQNQLAVKKVLEPRAIAKNQRKPKKFVTFIRQP